MIMSMSIIIYIIIHIKGIIISIIIGIISIISF